MSTKNFQVTIGYRAVINVDVKAATEEEAKKKALQLFNEKERGKWFSRQDINLQDDTYGTQGVLNMDETWGML